MSITLTAYPMAFLVAPENAPAEQICLKEQDNGDDIEVQGKNLKFIKVLTNITVEEMRRVMPELSVSAVDNKWYTEMTTDLMFCPEIEGKFLTFTVLRLHGNDKQFQAEAERFFTNLDGILGRNVRLLGNKETFYYHYLTEYESQKDIYKTLRKQGVKNIFTDETGGIVASVNGKNIRYYFDGGHYTGYWVESSGWMLEVEQNVTIMNIGVDENSSGRYSAYAMTNLKIPTNIKKNELKNFLKAANYNYYAANGNTPLRNSYVTLNWIEKDGYFTAEFSGQSNSAITREAETIFSKLNIAAGRDLRLVNDTAVAIYTYNTNYTDKGVLLNTLYEHGAQEITEDGDTVTCKLSNMEMKYYKQDNGAYSLDITQISDKSECENLIGEINEEYGLNMQEITYNKIKERLEQEDLSIESESVLDDNSILLTIEI